MKTTKIEWTQYTWNPFMGCRRASAGCINCYMHRILSKERDSNKVIRTSDKTFYKPLHINKPSMIFTCSMSDFFIEEADEWRPELWKIIRDTPHTYQILTKRYDRIKDHLPEDWGDGYKNVWLGVSIEDQDSAYKIIELAKLKGPNHKIWVSIEPLIGEIDFSANKELFEAFKKLDWVVVGGESGNETGKYSYRPSYIRWYYQILAFCDTYRKPIFVKQLGTYLAKNFKMKDKKGGEMKKFPKSLKRQEFPS